MGGEGVNSTSKVLQCSIFLFLAHHIQLAFYFMNYLYNSLSSNCGISKLPGKIQSWKRVVGFSDKFLIYEVRYQMTFGFEGNVFIFLIIYEFI